VASGGLTGPYFHLPTIPLVKLSKVAPSCLGQALRNTLPKHKTAIVICSLHFASTLNTLVHIECSAWHKEGVEKTVL